MNYKLIKFYGYMRRSAALEVVEVVNEEDWNLIQKAIEEGKELYLGEIAGKHSDVTWTLEDEEMTILSEDQAEIDLFMKWIPEGHVGPFYLAYEVRRAYGLEPE